MFRLRNYIIVGSGLFALALALVVTNAGSASAQSGGPPGSQESPLLVKVVNAIADAIPVEVTNKPTVQIDQTGDSNVVKLSNREPYQRSINNLPGQPEKFVNFRFDVPDGKRLVIESASVHVEVPAGQKVFARVSGNGPPGVPVGTQHLVLAKQGTFDGYDVYTGNHSVLMWVGPGDDNGNFHVQRSSTTGDLRVEAAVVGYLEDL